MEVSGLLACPLPACVYSRIDLDRTTTTLPGISTTASLLGATRAVSPPALRLAFRVFSRRSCPSAFCASEPLSWNFPAVWRIRSGGGHIPQGVSSSPVTVRVQGFSPSSRFRPPLALRVYFTPLTPFRFALQGFPLRESRRDSSSRLCRPAVSPRLRSHRLEDGTNGAPTTMPRVWVRAFPSTSRLCSPSESVAPELVISVL